MTNKNFTVGIFVSLALAAFVSATLWLSDKHGSAPTAKYSMFFEKDVGGLMLGGPVFYLGVSVGSVTAMEIIPGDPMRVRIDIDILQAAPVNQGTYASLAFQGITGVAVIKLNAEPGLHKPLQPSDGSKYPVITVRDTGFTALLSKAPEIVDRLDSVLVQISQVLGEENRKHVAGILGDLATLGNTLAAEDETIGQIPGLLSGTLKELDSGLVQIRSMLETLEPGLVSSVTNLEQATLDLAKITARMEAWTASNDAEMGAFMGDGLGQLPDLMTEARETLREIEKLVKALREDPSALIYQSNAETVDVEQE